MQRPKLMPWSPVLLRRCALFFISKPHPAAGLHAALTPASWIASVLLQLRINLVDIDPNPLVLDIARTPADNVPWSVS
jgi:hypothetical protein